MHMDEGQTCRLINESLRIFIKVTNFKRGSSVFGKVSLSFQNQGSEKGHYHSRFGCVIYKSPNLQK